MVAVSGPGATARRPHDFPVGVVGELDVTAVDSGSTGDSAAV